MVGVSVFLNFVFCNFRNAKTKSENKSAFILKGTGIL